MAKKIKLEGIVLRQKVHEHTVKSESHFCPECGENISGEYVLIEYVCENCRHLVEENMKFCPFCGGQLESSDLVEHYSSEGKLTDSQFKERKAKVSGAQGWR